MANLKDLLVNGPSRFIGDIIANKVQLTSLEAPTTSNGNVYGLGSSGQILKTNGSSVYWADNTATTLTSILPVTLGGTGKSSFIGNRLIFSSQSSVIDNAAKIYVKNETNADAYMAINDTSIVSGYNFQVTGNSNFKGGARFWGTIELGVAAETAGQIIRVGRSSNWYNGRDKAIISMTSNTTGYNPFMSIRADGNGTDSIITGTWDIGVNKQNSNYQNELIFSYITDTVYDNETNTAPSNQIRFKQNGIVKASEFEGNLTGNAATASAVPWSGITNKPTTLSGYGITDANISNGVITLGSNTITPLTSHQDISGKENTSNKVTSLSSSSTDTQYPSAKLVYDQLALKGNAKIYYGTCSTAAATTQKDVVCSAYTNTGDPVKGDIIFVTFDNTNSAAAVNLTLKVGNSTAKRIAYQSSTTTTNLPGGNYLLANNTYRFIYNGSNWVVMLNYNSDAALRVYTQSSGYDGDYPVLVGRTLASTLTAKNNATDTSVYGVIYKTNAPTLNPSRGQLKIPGSIEVGTSSTNSSTYTTTIYGIADINRLEIQEDIIPMNAGCKLGDVGWEWDTIYSNNYIGSAELTGTPTAPTAAANTNTTQIATTAFVQAAIAALKSDLNRIGINVDEE